MPAIEKRKISIAIPCYNSANFIQDALRYPILDERVDDIVISDDGSDDFEELSRKVGELNAPKIKIHRNTVNSGGCYKNKAIAASYAKNDWLILLDSDNFFDKNFIDALYSIHKWEENTFYCPANGMILPHFNFEDFDRRIDFDIFKEHLKGRKVSTTPRLKFLYTVFFNSPKFLQKLISYAFMMNKSNRFLSLMNDSNYFVNKESFLINHELSKKEKLNPFSADTIFSNFIWLRQNNYMQVVQQMTYFHTVHSESYWVKTMESYSHVLKWIIDQMDISSTPKK
ncbi:glycosyltransferase family 2 protein [Altibacter lentus]|uniref:glycosyltransferase family 2 protein n=1 Tax=Altibacter lentus TaxID=1223410 RepID=UPI00055362E2|nr:glycosyltransferase family A protein [Altibacter lentus]